MNVDHHDFEHFTVSNPVRAYINSLPQKLSVRDELGSYSFWKSLRTELLASFLFVVFTCSLPTPSWSMSSLVASNASSSADVHDLLLTSVHDQVNLVRVVLMVGLTVASLTQCTGHVSGCHLSISVTFALYVSSRVSWLRLAAYLVVQSLGSSLALLVLYALNGHAVASQSSSLVESMSDESYNSLLARMFGYQVLASSLVVLTYLANCDEKRVDLGFKSLSIAMAWMAAAMFAVS